MCEGDLNGPSLAIVRGTPWLLDAVALLREIGPRDAYIAAGALRDTVWNALKILPAAG